jgi:hypothetical protein
MSNAQAAAGRRPVVVAPALADRSGVNWPRALPVWIVSVVIHGAMLLLFSLLTFGGAARSDALTVAETKVQVGDEELPAFNEVAGLDGDNPFTLPLDRVDKFTVPEEIEPTAPDLGVRGAPEGPARQLSPPPGALSGPGGGLLAPEPGSAPPVGPGGWGGIESATPWGGRLVSGATREKYLGPAGGSQLSEAAVARGLLWFALHQASDGRWSLHEFHRYGREKPLPAGKTFACDCGGEVARRNDVAATAFGLLPFLGAGYTHKGAPKGAVRDYSKTVGQALNWLIGRQGEDGYYGGDMYAHGLATIAMCEAYGMTSDPRLKASAQRAVNYIVKVQDPAGGGWRYFPRQAGDTSVTGWQLMALKSGQMAGLAVPKKTLTMADCFLDSVESSSKGGYKYLPTDEKERVSMTAVALLCRQYSGVGPRNPALIAGVQRLKAVPPGRGGLYYEYYATQVMHHMQGDAWRYWNLGPDGSGRGGMRDTLIARQDVGATPRHGHQAGSWAPEADGGRVMSTSLSLLCLEVYYRHLPLYRTRELGVMKNEN